MIRESGNSARKKAQRALQQWMDSHLGPRWELGWKKFQTKHDKSVQKLRLQGDLLRLQNVREVLNDNTEFLRSMGFLEGATLTPRGMLASEVHEAHPLLLTMAVEDRLFNGLSQDDILLCLACFLEAPSGQEEPFLDQVGLSPQAQDALTSLGSLAHQFSRKEDRKSPPGY